MDISDLCHLKANTKVLKKLVRGFLFADYCVLVVHSDDDLQCLADFFSTALKAFGLSTSIKKTEVLHQAAHGTSRPEPSIRINGFPLRNVEGFSYLGNCLSSSGFLTKTFPAVWQAVPSGDSGLQCGA